MSDKLMISFAAEGNVVRKKAAVCGEERCVTSLKTAAKRTNKLNILKKYVKFRFQLIAYKTRFPIINLFKRSSACRETG